MMVAVGEKHTKKIKCNSVSFHCWKHSMFNGISSVHCNTTLIPTTEATGISCKFCGFFP